VIGILAAIAMCLSASTSAADASTAIDKCGKVTAYDFVESPSNAGTLRIDDVSFVVGLPGSFRRSDIPPLTVPYASIRLNQTVCVRGQVDPLPNGWHLLSGEVVITGQAPGLPATSTVPTSDAPAVGVAGVVAFALLATAGLFARRAATER
jgi:hypothetical protein